MSRRTEAPIGFDCPYRHSCPHLDHLSTTWALEIYRESTRLRDQYHVMEQRYQQRIAELEKTLLDRDAKIAQLRLQHQKRFKANVPPAPLPPPRGRSRKRGAPKGHSPWRRRAPDHLDRTIPVPAPQTCPHCQCSGLRPHAELYEHVQEDLVLVPRTRVTRFVHHQSYCPHCRHPVYQSGPGELPGCTIGPLTRAVAMHLRYDLQIPCRKLKKFASRLCQLRDRIRRKKLTMSKARAMIPRLKRKLKRFAGQPLDYPPAETLRDRIMNKDPDKLFTFLRMPGVEPTNNHSERSVRFLVIMRKICFGTRSAAGTESHSVLPSLLETACRQGKSRLDFLVALLTQPPAVARTALFAGTA